MKGPNRTDFMEAWYTRTKHNTTRIQITTNFCFLSLYVSRITTKIADVFSRDGHLTHVRDTIDVW